MNNENECLSNDLVSALAVIVIVTTPTATQVLVESLESGPKTSSSWLDFCSIDEEKVMLSNLRELCF